MNQILKFASLAIFFAITVTNISFGLNSQKEISIEQILLQKKLKQLNEEKEKEEASWFNKLYLPYKLFGDKSGFSDNIITFLLSAAAAGLLRGCIPENDAKNTIVAIGVLGCNMGLNTFVVQHKTRTTVRNEKIKNLEEILAEIKKNKSI